MFADEALVDKLIGNEYRAIRYYMFFALTLVILGIVVMVFAALTSGRLIPDAFKSLFGIGGAFVSSLSSFQIKEILNRRAKIDLFQTLKARLHDLEKERDKVDEDTRQRLDDMLYRVVDQTISR